MLIGLVLFLIIAVVAWVVISFIAHLVLGNLLLIVVLVAAYLLYKHTRLTTTT